MSGSLKTRLLRGELMDDPDLEKSKHVSALKGLRRINRVTNSYRPIWKEIRQIAKSQTSLSLLDVGCGGGDTLAALGRYARREGINLCLNGLDVSPTAVDSAQKLIESKGLSAKFLQKDVLNDHDIGTYDVVVCSLFTHHFSDADVETLLNAMRRATKQLMIVSDLRRTLLGYAYAFFGTRLLSRSRIVHIDGPRSVEAAFTIEEIRELCARCDLESASIRKFWPQRFLMQWSPAQ